VIHPVAPEIEATFIPDDVTTAGLKMRHDATLKLIPYAPPAAEVAAYTLYRLQSSASI